MTKPSLRELLAPFGRYPLPYSAGVAARARGEREADCPFHDGPVGSDQREYWLAGMRGQACHDEEEVRRRKEPSP